MAELTHWKKLINPDYFGSYLFQPSEEKVLTINNVVREIVTGADGKKEECTVIHWEEKEKPMILNSTNGKTISKVLETPYTEHWHGKRIALVVRLVKAFGDTVDAVRVVDRKVPQVASKATAQICADCGVEIKDKDGFKADVIVAGAVKRYGKALCMDCATKRKNAVQENPEVQA